MATEIKIPKLGLTMKEAKLVKWLIDAGQTVAAEQTVALIETDKVSFEIVSPAKGIVYPVVATGSMVLVAQIIGYVAADETELATLQKEQPAEVGPAAGQPEYKADKTAPTATGTVESKPGERIFASPLARRMAKEHGLNLAKIPGTGPGGRIVETDINQALGVAVIGTVHHNHIMLPCVIPGQAQGQFIGFTAGTYQKTNFQGMWKFQQQALSVFDNIVVQVAGVGVQNGHLKLAGRNDMGMAVAHMANVIDSIQILQAIFGI